MSVQIAKRLLTASEYHKMGEAGILNEDDRIELIHGEIIRMSPIGSRHAGHINRIVALFSELIRRRAVILSVQNPIAIGEYSEPEPDIALLKFRKDYYEIAHPKPDDVLLIIEVAESSLEYDREIKLPLFAGTGIPEYWIVNLEEEQIEVYRQPAKLDYGLKETFKRGDSFQFEPLQLKLKVEDILV